ncbi:MAG TPA: MAPEG family protein, partial [Polyangiaceae bacterium]|nr:MAPEG family protein [Polyangiaceae bacterium]
PIVAPVVALVVWTHVMWFWMYATRIPAIFAAKLKLDPNVPKGELMATLPPRVRWKADNYNHLFEQPTVFYAVALALAVIGQGGGVNATLAWVYVGLRVAHSLLQALWNNINARFSVFTLSAFTLMALTFNAARSVF